MPAPIPDGRRTQRALWALAGLLSMLAAGFGLVRPQIDGGPARLAAAAYGQELVGTVLGAALLALAAPAWPSARRDLPALGLVGYLAYASGMLVLEGAVDPLALVHLAVFALAVWSIVLAVAAARVTLAATTTPPPAGPRRVTVVCAVGALLLPVVLVPPRIASFVSPTAGRHPAGPLDPTSVLDLGFVLPAFLIAAVLLLRGRRGGALLAPPMFVFGTVLTGSLAIVSLVGPLFGAPVATGRLLPTVLLTVVLAVLAMVSVQAVQAVQRPRVAAAGGRAAPGPRRSGSARW